MKIYTKTGDQGLTGIHGGQRVPKDDPRIEANGTLDELNCALGLVRAHLPEKHPWQTMLQSIQEILMPLMSLVATPSAIRDKNPNAPTVEQLTQQMEQMIDQLDGEMGSESSYFILPGGTIVSAQLQMARAIARRAERRLWTLHHLDPLPTAILAFSNRLSDLLFTMARAEMAAQGKAEERWKLFLYKRPSQ